MRVFLDECIDWRLAREISGHEVRSARQMQWLTIKNGELLRLASEQFDVFLTVDRNLAFQQNVASSAIAVMVLQAPSNRLAELKRLIPELLGAIESLRPGTVTTVGSIQVGARDEQTGD